MSGYFFSATQNMFYHESLKLNYELSGTWPEDAVVCDDSVYQEFAADQPPVNKVRIVGPDNMPAWGDILSLTAEQTVAINTLICNKLASTAALAIAKIQCSAAVGNPREGDGDNLLALQQYVDTLRDVDLTVSPMVLPTVPAIIS